MSQSFQQLRAADLARPTAPGMTARRLPMKKQLREASTFDVGAIGGKSNSR